MFRLELIALLSLTYLGGLDGLKPKLVCRITDPGEIPLNHHLCTHIIYGSFRIGSFDRYSNDYDYHDSDELDDDFSNVDFPALNKMKEEYPQLKLIPYFSTLEFDCRKRHASWSKKAYLDGIAFSASDLLRCGENYLSDHLNAIVRNDDNFTKIAYFYAGSFPDLMETLPELSSYVDMVIWNGPKRGKPYGMDGKYLYPLSLKGRLVYDKKLPLDNTRLRSEPPYEEICKAIKSQGLLPEWSNETSSPFIRLPEGIAYFDNELSIAQKAKEALDRGFVGVSVTLSEDDSSGSCGEQYPLLTAVKEELFPPSPTDLFATHKEQRLGISKPVLKETVSYCMWKNNLKNNQSFDMKKLSGCSYIGFEPTRRADKTTVNSLISLQISNPLMKVVIAVNFKYFLKEMFNFSDLQGYMSSNNIKGLDIILDSRDLSNDEIFRVSDILRKMKDSKDGCSFFYILSIRDRSSIYRFRNLLQLTQIMDYVNIAHFYSYDEEFPNKVISAAPLTSSFDYKNIVFSINYAILEGVPAKKILLGIPNFGYSYSIVDAISLKETTFEEVCELLESSNVTTGWDTFSATPYVNSSDKFVTYENSTSIQMKLEFTTRLGLGGVSLYWIDSEECEGASDDRKTATSQIKEYIVQRNNRTWMFS